MSHARTSVTRKTSPRSDDSLHEAAYAMSRRSPSLCAHSHLSYALALEHSRSLLALRLRLGFHGLSQHTDTFAALIASMARA